MSKNRKDITCCNFREKGHFRNQCLKPSSNKGKKEVNMDVDLKDDALICCVENSTESWIMNFGASFQASRPRDVMQKFQQYKWKVRLVDNKTLDIVLIYDVVLKRTIGTNWAL